MSNLKEVFDAISAHDLRIKAPKCLLAIKEVTFLGHKLNRNGVKPAEQNVQTITNWPVPTSVKEVQVFLGAFGWYRKFIKNFSTVARQLKRPLEKIVKFAWEKSEKNIFKHESTH